MTITLPTSDPMGQQVAEFDTTTLLEHAAKQARQRNYQDLFIVDVDSHHYETESMADINDYFEDPVIRHLAKASLGAQGRAPGFRSRPCRGQSGSRRSRHALSVAPI